MSGIVGYIGKNNAEKNLIDLLKKIEHKGYDSSGVAVQLENRLEVIKSEGKIRILEDMIKDFGATTGIGHIRWATHGKPTRNNAHPHTSMDKNWAIVHNGIIENFIQLKTKVNNMKFSSETDSEIIAQLLQREEKSNPIETFIGVCNQLEGAFAVACVNQNYKGHLLLGKRKSPLFIARTSDEVLIASDAICFDGKTNEYYSLDDNEFCDASENKLIFYDKNFNIISKASRQIEHIEKELDKQNYPHFMLKEIHEIPQVLKKIVSVYKNDNIFSQYDSKLLDEIKQIVLVGCGTAYHAGLMGAKFIEKFTGIQTKTYVASEFAYTNPIIDSSTLCIFVSQSGETSDTIMAQRLANSKGAICVALTNVNNSTLAKNSDLVLPVCAGPEIAVASTKAYNAQITILFMLAKQIENILHNKTDDFYLQISNLANELKFINIEEIKELAAELKNEKTVFFIGRDFDYISCEEASLKLKETTYINSTAYPSGELKHGFLALIEEGTYLFVLATQKDLLEKTLNGAHEAYARGAKVVLITQFDVSKESMPFVHKIIQIQKFDEGLMPITSIITFQLLSYFTSIGKNINPDQPRYLTKSVTVE